MSELAKFCIDKENKKICTKVNNKNICVSYADPKIWERYGGCPLNSIPVELVREEERKKKIAERSRFSRPR